MEAKPVNTTRSARPDPLSTLLSLTGIIAAAVLLRIVFETLGQIVLWPEKGSAQSCDVMMTEWSWLTETTGSAQWLISLTLDFVRRINETVTSSDHLFLLWGKGSYAARIRAFEVTIACSLSDIFIRLIRLLLTLPALLLSTLVGFVDGLVMRDIRRFSIGNESAFLHHRIRKGARAFFCSATLAYLAVPYAIASMWLALFTALMVVVVFYLASSFKKYI